MKYGARFVPKLYQLYHTGYKSIICTALGIHLHSFPSFLKLHTSAHPPHKGGASEGQKITAREEGQPRPSSRGGVREGGTPPDKPRGVGELEKNSWKICTKVKTFVM